ncbi:hypothetical protein [Flavobacterium sp. H122]|uniref:hypothetical protein n=1 Tax=Flavobacterium sp. H122 TaxID=2529860 RepID=UPI0010A9DD78|nr:hypothetical protein [Flavobacterium sp. H122]
MKTFKRIVFAFLALTALSAVFGYFYFDRKFTPEKNYLSVKNQSGKVPIVWQGSSKNAMLIPIKFEGDTAEYFLQFDTGSPYTVFYKNSAAKIQQITLHKQTAKTGFLIGRTKIFSTHFRIIDYGEKFNKNDSVRIIGTLGSDILENRKTLINFKENFIEFNLSKQPEDVQNKLFDFEFKKRKIIIPGILKEKEGEFLYDSGTSAYELLSDKETWNNLKTAGSKIVAERANSWQNTLTTYSAKSDIPITFNKKNLQIKAITYVDGFSKTQYLLMKFSGMTGMLGNKFFLENTIYLDCSVEKIAID